MKIYTKSLCLAIFSLCLLPLSFNGFAQDSLAMQYAKSITASDLKKHLEIIASDAYKGRETGTEGQKMAAEYITNAFKEYGLMGPVTSSENPYLQSFSLEKRQWDDVYLSADDVLLIPFRHFFPYGNFKTKEVSLELVFAGYGIETASYSDYNNIDVSGKAVAILMGEPFDDNGNPLVQPKEGEKKKNVASNSYKLKLAKQKGAKAAILVYQTNDAFNSRNSMMKNYMAKPSISFPLNESSDYFVFYTGPAQVAALLNTNDKKLSKSIAKIGKKRASTAGSFSNEIKIKASKKIDGVSTENVLGFLEGTSKKEEIVVLTAHYDHIGMTGPEINNGADDDGSGTVSILELAEAFTHAAKNGHRPKRSILFMTFTGEEKGLLGSRYYAENPVFPMENTVTNLNIDMVGRVDEKHKDNPYYIYLIGSDMLSSDLHQLSEETAKTYLPNLELDYQYNAKDDPNRFYYRSDHYNFAKYGVPVIFYFNGTHEDYHKPTDTVEKIHFEKMEKIAQLVFHTAWEIANREARVTVDQKEAAE